MLYWTYYTSISTYDQHKNINEIFPLLMLSIWNLLSLFRTYSTSQFKLTTIQVANNYTWLLATVFDNTKLELLVPPALSPLSFLAKLLENNYPCILDLITVQYLQP